MHGHTIGAHFAFSTGGSTRDRGSDDPLIQSGAHVLNADAALVAAAFDAIADRSCKAALSGTDNNPVNAYKEKTS